MINLVLSILLVVISSVLSSYLLRGYGLTTKDPGWVIYGYIPVLVNPKKTNIIQRVQLFLSIIFLLVMSFVIYMVSVSPKI